MNRDELLDAAFGPGASRRIRPGNVLVETLDRDTGAVVAHLDLYWRRVLVKPQVGRIGIQTAATTLTVAAVGNLCVDPDAADKDGTLVALLGQADREMKPKLRMSHMAAFAAPDARSAFLAAGWARPADADQPGFLVKALRDGVAWPAGRIVFPGGEW